MAEPLDRVRISAAELRAGATSFVEREAGTRGIREARKGPPLGRKRPDLQRYRPGQRQCHKAGETQNLQCGGGTGEGGGTEPSDRVADADTDGNVQPENVDSPCCSTDLVNLGNKYNHCAVSTPKPSSGVVGFDQVDLGKHSTTGSPGADRKPQDSRHPAQKHTPAIAGVPDSSRLMRRVRKPDRQIYKPGCLRDQHLPPESRFASQEHGNMGPAKRAARNGLAVENLTAKVEKLNMAHGEEVVVGQGGGKA
ncbi:uncharacterized protein LOC108921299 [Scleropages formosus]|uniref:uncharacterized protein LOC108921299 n=1 Tax=Scleropages formosus TaxID=113540 RepID=UPI0006352296|nr:uncharacterized protein LOC108921299 [Scleropages formosus]